MSGTGILIVAGELSGDLHGANLVEALRELRSDLDFFGVAGPRLRGEGVRPVARSEDLAHMGLVEVLRELPALRRIMRALIKEAAERRPALAILVDSPDFNLRLASRLKRLGIPVLLYISPQLRAWRKGRVRKVRKLAKEVLCILPFETDFYHRQQVPARYVGHPLVDEVGEAARSGGHRSLAPGMLALLPGSRAMEIRSLLPAMLEGLRLLPDGVVSSARLIVAPGVEEEIAGILSEFGKDERLNVCRGEARRSALAECDLAWTASGTATLECALLDVPMIVGYRLKAFSWFLARMLVDVPHVALVNLIAEGALVPELLQKEWNPQRLAEVTRELVESGLGQQLEGLALVRERLGRSGASRQAAKAVLEHLAQSR